MMAFRVASSNFEPTPKRRPAKAKGYLAWLHELPCCVSGAYGVQAAHLSYAAPEYGHYGRGKGSKASDRWALPLSPQEHARQHSMSERAYWAAHCGSPHVLCLTLYGLWTEMGDDATPFATAIINQRIYRETTHDHDNG